MLWDCEASPEANKTSAIKDINKSAKIKEANLLAASKYLKRKINLLIPFPKTYLLLNM
jgi:hypothetical protein